MKSSGMEIQSLTALNHCKVNDYYSLVQLLCAKYSSSLDSMKKPAMKKTSAASRMQAYCDTEC